MQIFINNLSREACIGHVLEQLLSTRLISEKLLNEKRFQKQLEAGGDIFTSKNYGETKIYK